MMENIENYIGRKVPLIVPIRPLSMRVCAVAKKKTIKRHIRPFIVCVCSLGALSLAKRFIRPMKTKGPIGDFEKS